MSLADKELKILELEHELEVLKRDDMDHSYQIKDLQNHLKQLKKDAYDNMTAYDRVYLARKQTRAHIHDYLDFLFDDYLELHGDRLYKDDHSICGGLAMMKDIPVTFIGHVKGDNLEDNLDCNFGMPSPEGYRKALRLMKQAEKFNRPVMTFIDTPGAYPGLKAEKHGIGEAIARNILEMSHLTVPIITIIMGEGGSGGALALGVGDRVFMLENSVYSVLSPEGFASILWKDQAGKRVKEAAELMKMTAHALYEMKVIDKVYQEPQGGLKKDTMGVVYDLKNDIYETLQQLKKLSKKDLVNQRYQKYREIGK